jgi:hypothetical protein
MSHRILDGRIAERETARLIQRIAGRDTATVKQAGQDKSKPLSNNDTNTKGLFVLGMSRLGGTDQLG